MKLNLPTVIKIDAIAGAVAGTAMLLGQRFLAPFLGLSTNWLTALAIIAFIYASYAGLLTITKVYRPVFVRALLIANTIYSLFGMVLLATISATLTRSGIAYLLLESLFVGTLAWLEYRRSRQFYELST